MNIKRTFTAVLCLAAGGYGLYRVAKGGEMQKYSSKWFEKAPDSVLEEERENVRKQFISAGGNYNLAVRLQNLLHYFDKVMEERKRGDGTGCKFPVHGEHGWYLSGDD